MGARAPRDVVETALEHECRIHLVLFALLIAVLTVYSLGFPVYAIFIAEHRVLQGLVVLAVATVAGTAVFGRTYVRLTSDPQDNDQPNGIYRVVSTFLGRLLPRRRAQGSHALFPLPDSTLARPFRDLLKDLANSVPEPLLNRLAVCWEPRDLRAAARVQGSDQMPVLVVSGGLAAATHKHPSLVRAILLHEVAHIAHHDPRVLSMVRAAVPAWACASVSMIVIGLAHLYRLTGDEPLYLALGLLVTIAWALTIALAALCLVRYAGFLYSLRELMADVTASVWLGDGRQYADIIRPLVPYARSFSGRLRSLLSLRLTHFSEGERLDFLENDSDVLLPKLRYFTLTAVFAGMFQSSPFLVGYGNTALIVFLVVFSCAIAAALVLSVALSVYFMGLAGTPIAWTQLLALAAVMTIFYHLPLLEVKGLGDVLAALFVKDTAWYDIAQMNWLRLRNSVQGMSWLSAFIAYALYLRLVAQATAAQSDQGIRQLRDATLIGGAVHLTVMLILRWESVVVVEPFDSLQETLTSNTWLIPVGVVLPSAVALAASARRTAQGRKTSGQSAEP